jgi:hypothetical protein
MIENGGRSALELEKVPELPSIEANVIANADFCLHLNKLLGLRDFIVSQNIKDQSKSEPASIVIGRFNSFRYAEKGRQVSDAEWDELNEKLQYFYGLLNDTERRKFHFKRAAPMLKMLPTLLVGMSVILLIIPALYANITHEATPWVYFTVFLLWTVAVGALGSMAFILVNALGIQVDPTVDVTDRDSTWFRVLLGALFAIILTLPFGYPSFQQFSSQIATPEQALIDFNQAALLLMPFLFGFSTSLVLTVLNRLVESVQTFFGVNTKKT